MEIRVPPTLTLSTNTSIQPWLSPNTPQLKLFSLFTLNRQARNLWMVVGQKTLSTSRVVGYRTFLVRAPVSPFFSTLSRRRLNSQTTSVSG